MKTTIEIPDDLYRRVKAKAALQGRAIREVTTDLYRIWLEERPVRDERSAEQWMEDWIRLGRQAVQDAPDGPTATEILAADREGRDPDAREAGGADR